MLAVMATAVPVGAGSKVESAPLAGVIRIDGDDSDWQDVKLLYQEGGVRILGVTHDADNLYLMWRFGDERLARRILARGVMVWVNGDNKKKETFGLRYGGSVELSRELPPLDEGDLPEGSDPSRFMEMRHQLTICVPGYITLFDDSIEIEVPEDNPDGPRAASAFRDGLFVYEVKIPMVSIGGKVASLQADARRKLVVGVQVGGLSPDEMKEMQDRMRDPGNMGPVGMGGPGGGMGGGMRGGMGGPGGGGMGGGMMGRGGGPGGGGRGPMGPQDVLWMKVVLAPVAAGQTASQ
jgi:hypothetical protein